MADYEVGLKIKADTKEAEKEITSFAKTTSKQITDIQEKFGIKIHSDAFNIAKSVQTMKSVDDNLANALDKYLLSNNYIPSQAGVTNELEALITAYNSSIGNLSDSIVNDSGSSKGNKNIDDTSQSITELTGKIKDIDKELGSLKGSLDNTRKSSDKLSKSTKKLNGFFDKLGNRIKSILMYRTIRGTLSKISQYLREGISNLVLYEQTLNGLGGTKATDTTTALSTALQTLKNSLGSVAITVLSTFQPILEKLIASFTSIINAINQFFTALAGGTYYKKATNAVYNYGKAVSKTRKELQLLAFDELNILKDTSSSNDGGTAYADMFKDAKVSDSISNIAEKFADFVSKLNESFDKIKEKFKKICEDIKGIIPAILTGDWDKVREITSKLFDDLSIFIGTFLDEAKGLISPALELIKGILVGFVDFIENKLGSLLDWISDKTGIKLNFVKDIFHEVFNGLKNFISITCDGLKTVLTGFVSFISGVFTGNWQKAWNGVVSVFQGIFGTINTLIANTLNTSINLINKFLDGINNIFGTNWHIGTLSLSTSNIESNIKKTKVFKDAQVANRMASGGVPTTGTLFWAGEAGAEVIGSVGGRTTVYNSDQLGNAMATANADVVNAINTLIGVVRSKSGNVTISASDIRKAVNQSSMRVGV